MERSRADAAALCGEVQRGSAYGADPTTDVGAAVINAVVMARKAGYIAATTGCSRERAEAAYEAAALAKKQAAVIAAANLAAIDRAAQAATEGLR